ncbi:MAG: putative toxin-antitoxin system toxin component, PIN family [Desulfatitalea sp.]
MRIVLDTNVLVSGLLTPFGSSGEIVRMLFSGELSLYIDVRILSEYRDVLSRPKFQFNKEHIATLLLFIHQNGIFVSTSPLSNHLPDIDDEPFLEVAIAGKAACLITGNMAHYPSSLRQKIKVLSPSKFLEYFREKQKK